MTDREAIDMLRYYSEHGLGEISSYESGEIADILEDALQERIDREKGCEWCNGIGKTPENWECSLVGEYGTVTTVDHEVIWTTATVCPVCGRKLKTAMTGEEV